MSILESKAAAPFFLALLIGGCPKRQTAPLVVYVQPPPAAGSAATSSQSGRTVAGPKASAAANQASTPNGSMEAMVIEEPPAAPPRTEPDVITLPPPATTSTVQAPKKGRTRAKPDSHDTEEDTGPTDSGAPASPAEVPSLEPRSDVAPNDGTEGQLLAQDDDIRRRLNDLDKNPGLSTTERRTLKDASSFWSQSMAAVREHDLLRARELAQKASLLLVALEKR